MYDYLTDSAKDVLESIDIPDETWKELEDELERVSEEFSIQKDGITLVNFGSRTTPALCIEVNGVIAENISIDKNGKMEIDRMDNVEATLSVQETSKENIKDIAGQKDMTQVFEEMTHTDITPENISRSEILQKVFDKINGTLTEQGIESKYSKNMQKQALKEAGKEEYPNRREMKSKLNETKEVINSLYKELQQETAIARANGFSLENTERINVIGEKIATETIKMATYQDNLPSLKESVMDAIKNKSEILKVSIKESFDKVKVGLDMKIQTGVTALKQLKNEVSKANEQFLSIKDTAYTNVIESTEQIHRNWMAVNYSIDKTMVNEIDKQCERLEKSYEKKANIKGAVKDVWRAITGNERTGERAEFTPKQTRTLEALKSLANNMRADMKDMKKDYEISKAASIQNMHGAQEYRKDTGLNLSESLEKNMQKAKERSIEGGKNNSIKEQNINKDKTEPSR